MARGCHKRGSLGDAPYTGRVNLPIEIEREVDGRRIATMPSLPKVFCYGPSKDQTVLTSSSHFMTARKLVRSFWFELQASRPSAR